MYAPDYKSFQAFMNCYLGSQFMFNLDDRFLSFYYKSSSLCGLWGICESPYVEGTGDCSMTILCNSDYGYDKTFSTIDLYTDVFEASKDWAHQNYNVAEFATNETFDSMSVWNEYQQSSVTFGETALTGALSPVPSNLKEKFRVWRIQFPRPDGNPFDRFRGQSVFTRFKKSLATSKKSILFHYAIVNYLI